MSPSLDSPNVSLLTTVIFFVWLQGIIERYLPSGSLEAMFPFMFPFPFPLPLPLASLMLQFEDITSLLKVGEDIIRLFFAQAHTAWHVSFHFESVTKHAIGSRTQQYPSPHLESHAVLTASLNNDSRDESSDIESPQEECNTPDTV